MRRFSANAVRRVTLRSLHAQYARGERITALTCYDAPSGRHVDASGADLALVGDSLGMVVLGEQTTQSVTLDAMVHHARAVRRSVKRSLLVADLPFGTYETSPAQAAGAAIRLVKESGVDAVKMEGGASRAHLLRAIHNAGVAVMGHIGLQPQAVSALGGFRAVGRNAAEAKVVLEDAAAVTDAGAFAMVLECVPAQVARIVTRHSTIPTIGIGSGADCSGQILVYHDVLGIGDYSPSFAKRYAEVGTTIVDALTTYGKDVRNGTFPSDQHCGYNIPREELTILEEMVSDMDMKKEEACGSRGAEDGDGEEDKEIKVY